MARPFRHTKTPFNLLNHPFYYNNMFLWKRVYDYIGQRDPCIIEVVFMVGKDYDSTITQAPSVCYPEIVIKYKNSIGVLLEKTFW